MRTCLGFVLGLAISVTSTPARADAESEARARLSEARALYAQGKYDEARVKMQQACAAVRTPKCLQALAQSEFKSGRFVDAHDRLRDLLSGPDASTFDAKTITVMREFYEEASKKIGHLEIDTDPSDRVYVDAAEAAFSPSVTVSVTPGLHVVEARSRAGVVRREVNALAGVVTKVSLREPHPPAGLDVAPVVSTRAPEPPPPSAPGGSNVRLPVVLGVAGAGVAALVAGAVKGVESRSAWNDVAAFGACKGSECAGAPQAKADDASRAGLWSGVLYASGAALVGTAAVLWFVLPKPEGGTTRPALVPHASPASAGVDLHVAF